jgi:hypothetical protein
MCAMTFQVQPGALDACASRFDTLASTFVSARTYVEAGTSISHADAALFAHVAFLNDDIRVAVSEVLARGRDTVRASGTELTASARMYRTTDQSSAAALDATYRAQGVDPGLDEAWRSDGSAAPDPSKALVTPVAEQPIPSLVDTFMSFPDFVSPSHWLLWVIDKICGVNPAEWLAEQFAGDWEAMARASSAYKNAAEYVTQAAVAIRTDGGQMLASWSGEAAAACERYLAQLADALDTGPAQGLEKVSDELKAVAYGVWATAKTAVGLLESLLDTMIEAAIAAAAAAASSWTVVGGLVGGGIAAERILNGIRLFRQIMDAHSLALNIAWGASGVIAGGLGLIRTFEDAPVPAGYDHPGAR